MNIIYTTFGTLTHFQGHHALMSQLPTTHLNDIIKSLATVKVVTSLINLATYLKYNWIPYYYVVVL